MKGDYIQRERERERGGNERQRKVRGGETNKYYCLCAGAIEECTYYTHTHTHIYTYVYIYIYIYINNTSYSHSGG